MHHWISREHYARAVVTVLVLCGAIVCADSWSCARSTERLPAATFRFPDTLAGRAAAAYVQAFNSQSDERIEAFVRDYRPQPYIAERPMEERISQCRKLHDTFATLSPLRTALSLDPQITFPAKGSHVNGVLVFRFQVDEALPHKIAFISTSSVGSSELSENAIRRMASDENTLRVADRAQPADGRHIEETARAVARIVDEKYLDQAVGKAMADTTLSHLADGWYADITRAGQLADALTEAAVAVSKDRHVWIEPVNPLRVQSTYAENRPIEELRRENCHFRKVEILTGHVGYIKFDMIHDDQEAQDIAARAMASVKDCDALIHLRDNIGGAFESGRLIMSYVLPANAIVSKTYDRTGRLVRTNATFKRLPGARFAAAVPVYVLTSNHTGSAAEGFAYALQQSRRGTVVGQTTLGMAHPSQEVTVNSRFLMSVPIYRVESAFTEKSFQGVGVIPDISVPERNALETALEDAKKRIHDTGRKWRAN